MVHNSSSKARVSFFAKLRFVSWHDTESLFTTEIQQCLRGINADAEVLRTRLALSHDGARCVHAATHYIRTEKQKRRCTGFLNNIALKDSIFQHLSILTDDERNKMAMAFLQVGERSDPWLAIRCASMHFDIDGMWTRAEDPCNRTLSDLHAFEYPPSGRTGASQSVMECICASKDSGKTTSPTGHWEVQTYTHHKEWLLCPIFWLALWMVVKYEAPGWKDIVPCPDVLAGREQGHGLQRVYCNAKTPHESISPAAHGYATDQARKRANKISFKNTYEGRSTKPNSLVAQFGTNPKWIGKARCTTLIW
ncbi:hypothetical protein WJX82_004381 [Trebouxia sp. C0006]